MSVYLGHVPPRPLPAPAPAPAPHTADCAAAAAHCQLHRRGVQASAPADRATVLTVEREASRDALANLVAAEAALSTAITLGMMAGWGDVLQDLRVTADTLRWAIRDVQP